MGFFSDVLSGITGSGGDIGSAIIPSIIQGGAALIGSGTAQDANTRGANQVNQAIGASIPVYNDYSAQSRDAMRTGGTAAEGQLDTGLAQSAPIYQSEISAGSPGTSYLRSLVGQNPYAETPSDTIARRDLATSENNSLANSGLRGSGRAVAGVMNDTLSRFDAGIYDRNKAASMGAAGTLNNLYARGSDQLGADYSRTGTLKAGIESGVGSQAAGSLQNEGSYDAGATAREGSNTGQATTSNGQIGGQTLGTLGSIVADSIKQNRLQRYTPQQRTV